MSGWTPEHRLLAQTLRGRIIRVMHASEGGRSAGGLAPDFLHAFVCRDPRDPEYVRPDEFAQHLQYLADGGYVDRVEVTDPLEPTRTFWRLLRKGVDLYEGSIPADPGVRIER